MHIVCGLTMPMVLSTSGDHLFPRISFSIPKCPYPCPSCPPFLCTCPCFFFFKFQFLFFSITLALSTPICLFVWPSLSHSLPYSFPLSLSHFPFHLQSLSLYCLCPFSVPFCLPLKNRIGWSTVPTGCCDLRRALGPSGRWNTQMNLGAGWLNGLLVRLVVMFDIGRNSSSWSVEQSASKLLRTSRGG